MRQRKMAMIVKAMIPVKRAKSHGSPEAFPVALPGSVSPITTHVIQSTKEIVATIQYVFTLHSLHIEKISYYF